MYMALALTGGGPSLIIIFYTMIIDGLFSHHSPRSTKTGRRKLMGPYRFMDRVWELNCGILGLFLSQAAAFAITSALKNATGKPRPDIIDRCLLPEDLDLPLHGLANFTMCTQTDAHMIKDGFRSFPSGHSSCKPRLFAVLVLC
jgi:membrane-associated phospholipid phosphatase